MARNTIPASYLWPNWLSLALAIWLFVSPWILVGPPAGAWAWDAWVVSVILAGLSLTALAQLAEWEDWANLALGVWLFFSPWIFGYSSMTNMAWNSYIVGILIGLVALWGIVAARLGPPAPSEQHR